MSATAPASHASAFRAFAGRRAATKLPTNGRARTTMREVSYGIATQHPLYGDLPRIIRLLWQGKPGRSFTAAAPHRERSQVGQQRVVVFRRHEGNTCSWVTCPPQLRQVGLALIGSE